MSEARSWGAGAVRARGKCSVIRIALLGPGLLVSSAVAGPISKFANRPPLAAYLSSATIYDIERCLLDMDNQPVARTFSQPLASNPASDTASPDAGSPWRSGA